MKSRYRYLSYVLGAGAARSGDEMSGPALLLLVLAATGSPVLGSALLACLTASAALGGPLLGAMLDRSRRPGPLLAAALAAYASGLAAVALGLGRLPDVLVLAIAFAAGVAGPALTGGWTAQLPRLLAAEELERGFSRDAATYGFAALAGPALAGGIAASAGAGPAIVVAVALLLLAAPAALLLPRAATGVADERPKPAALPAEIGAGFGALLASRPLRATTAATMLSHVGLGAFVVACPLLGEDLTGDAGAGALLLTALALGSLLGNAALARRPWPSRPESLLLASTTLLGLATLAIAIAGSFALSVALAVLAGIGDGPQLGAVFALRHREAPPDLRSRVFVIGASLKISAFALGSALAGPLAVGSTTAPLLLAAVAQLLAVLVFGLLDRPTRRPGSPGGRYSITRARSGQIR